MTDMFEAVSKEKFRNAANKLLCECFILKKCKDTAADYNFILNNREFFNKYFDFLGYELIIEEQCGVIALNNPSGSGRVHLKKVESVLILILRLLYIEKKRQLSQTEDAIVIADEIYDKYNMLKMNAKLDKTTMRNSLGMFQRYRLINKLDNDMSNPDTRIIIYPSILFAIPTTNLDEVYNTAKEKLEKYSIGGESNDINDSTDDEEADEG